MPKADTQFEKGQSGNPAGRPKGSRNRSTLALDALLSASAESITRKAIEMALKGDTQALRMCLDRINPVRRDRPVHFEMPAMVDPADIVKATNAMLSAVASGELTPTEAGELGKLVTAHIQAIEMGEWQPFIDEMKRTAKRPRR